MLLEQLEQNRHALMQIGQKAVRRGRELGLTPSCTDLNGRDETEFEDRADVDDDVPPAEVMKR